MRAVTAHGEPEDPSYTHSLLRNLAKFLKDQGGSCGGDWSVGGNASGVAVNTSGTVEDASMVSVDTSGTVMLLELLRTLLESLKIHLWLSISLLGQLNRNLPTVSGCPD
jgi:hypothetical protein